MKLTIVLTLKGREEFTYRWLKYMNDIKCSYKILIADGGNNPDLEKYLRSNNNYPNLNYEYIKYPLDKDIQTYYNKLLNVLSKVSTEYTLLADNDDFYILDQIPDLIEYLDRNQDFVAARGKLVNFEVFDNLGISKGKLNGIKYKATPVYAPSIESDSKLDRIDNLCRGMSIYDYYNNWYSIIRSKVLIEIWNKLITPQIKDVIVIEILFHILIVESGKVKVFDTLFYLRQLNTSSFGDTLIEGNEFLERCLVNNSLSEFNYAVENFIKHDNKNDQFLVLKSIATWLDVFLLNIRNRNLAQNKDLFWAKKLIKDMRYSGSRFNWIYNLSVALIGRERKSKAIRIPQIEQLILKK